MKWYTNVAKLGNHICIRGVDEHGNPYKDRWMYEPTLYIETDKETGFTSIEGKKLKPISFGTITEMLDFANSHRDSNLKLYGFPHVNHQYILEEFGDVQNVWDTKKIRKFNIDIEVFSDEGFPEAREANYPITAICIHDSITDKFIVFAFGGKWSEENSELSSELLDKTKVIICRSEQDLLEQFLKFWQAFTPDVVTGWNTEFFDIPYIHNRLLNLGFDVKKLSPWRHVLLKEIQTTRGTEQSLFIAGISSLDYLPMYRKRKVQDSYRLDNIAEIELGQKKLDYTEVTGLHQLYKTNFQKYIDYNIQDVNLVKLLDEKLGLIDAQFALGYMACLNAEEASSPVRMWDALINKELFAKNQIVPYHARTDASNRTIPGGYVKEPHVGKHGWCVSFDLNSLYPHLIMQYNISPETLNKEYRLWPEATDADRLNRLIAREPFESPEGHCVAGSGHAYSNEVEGFIPRIMRTMYQERKTVKKNMLKYQQDAIRYKDAGDMAKYREADKQTSLANLKQNVIKIALNSGYGALANKYYRWFDNRLGESITLSGQLAIRTSEKALNKWMNKLLNTDKDYVIAIDTDSNYVNVQPLVDKFFSNKSKDEIVDILNKVCEEQMRKAIDEGYADLAQYTNAFENAMVMEREAIASSAVWTAKKRYAMNVWDMEGVRYEKEAKVKIQGLEAIRSSTPMSCRKELLEIIKLILDTDEQTVQTYLSQFKEKFMNLPFEEIAMPRTMNNVSKQTRNDNSFNKGTPPHVRGAIAYNKLLLRNGLTNWESIKDGDKAKFMYLRQPNNVGTDVISFYSTLPKELNIEQYIDKEKMFEKVVIDPVKNILDPINWSPVKIQTLADFFG